MTARGPAALGAWLALAEPEEILLPDLPIVDPHHHLWDRGGHRYLHAEWLADAQSGHRIEASIHVECRSHYREDGAEALRPVGETLFAAREGQAARRVDPAIDCCAAIVAHADLALGDRLGEILDAHAEAADGRLRGIRYATAWDPSSAIHGAYPTEPRMLDRADIHARLATLARRGLIFDAWLYFHQLEELAAAADACPDMTIVLNHLGGPIGIGPYAERRDEIFNVWRDGLAKVAARPNVVVKLGGLGMTLAGFGLRKRAIPAGSEELAGLWRPYIETAIGIFGTSRAMFESNFPPDSSSSTYASLWNAFKIICRNYSAEERDMLFSNNARRIYGLS